MSLKPPWPFLWLYGLENLTGRMDTMFQALGALFVALAALPFLDRGPERHPARRKGTLAVAGMVFLAMIGLTVYAAVAPPQLHQHEHGSGNDMPAMSHDTGTPETAMPEPSPADEHHHEETPPAHAP
jgi:quinol-cytochrome oxidoreductase complex cytochrome b subunit